MQICNTLNEDSLLSNFLVGIKKGSVNQNPFLFIYYFFFAHFDIFSSDFLGS